MTFLKTRLLPSSARADCPPPATARFRPALAQVSPRVGHVWRTGQAACSGGWFRPSPNMVQRQQAQQAQMQTARSQ